MQITQVVHRYPPRRGGIENYVWRLVNELKLSDDISVITSDYKTPKEGRTTEATYLNTHFSPLDNPLCLRMPFLIRDMRPDILHTHGHWFFTSIFSAAVKQHVPLVMTAHNSEMNYSGSQYEIANTIFSPIGKWTCQRCNKIIALTNYDKVNLISSMKLNPDLVEVVPNGIYPEEFRLSREQRCDFEARMQLNSDTTRLLYVSRIAKDKRQDLLIQALRFLPENFEVVLVGSCEDIEYLMYLKQISSQIGPARIKILLNLNRTDLIEIYHHSDVFVFLGMLEGLPTVILEAMASGLPILTSNVGGIKEVVKQENGAVIEDIFIKPETIASVVTDLFKNKSLAENARIINPLRIRENYDWKVLSKRIRGIYKGVIN